MASFKLYQNEVLLVEYAFKSLQDSIKSCNKKQLQANILKMTHQLNKLQLISSRMGTLPPPPTLQPPQPAPQPKLPNNTVYTNDLKYQQSGAMTVTHSKNPNSNEDIRRQAIERLKSMTDDASSDEECMDELD